MTKSYCKICLLNHPQFDISVDYNPCDSVPCKNQGSCTAQSSLINVTSVSEYEDTVFNSPSFEQRVRCHCGAQFSGEFCQIQKNPCDPSPCQFDGQCIQDPAGDGFECLCSPLRLVEDQFTQFYQSYVMPKGLCHIPNNTRTSTFAC